MTLTLWEDLGIYKVTKNFSSLVGWEVSKGVRVSAMERLSTTMVVLGPFGITFSRVFIRGEL